MLNFGFQSHKQKRFRFWIPDYIKVQYKKPRENEGFVCCKTSWIERFHSVDQHLCKFIETKEIVCTRKEFNSHRIWFGTPIWPPWRHVLKHSIAMLRVLPPTNQICLATNQFVAGCGKLLPKVESCSTFCKKICTTCARFTGPRQTCFAASDVTSTYPRIARLQRNFSSQHPICTQLTPAWFVARQV